MVRVDSGWAVSSAMRDIRRITSWDDRFTDAVDA